MDPQEFQKKIQEEGNKAVYYHELKGREKNNKGKSTRKQALITLFFFSIFIIVLWYIFIM
jgi:hypothetical protein